MRPVNLATWRLGAVALSLSAGVAHAARDVPVGALVYEVSPGPSGPNVVAPSTGAPASAFLSRRAVTAWVQAAARSVSAYFGRFPIAARVVVIPARAGSVGHGETFGRPVATIRIALGPATTEGDLSRDWVLTHEMVHLAFPSVRAQPWLEEGVATYVEPIARAKSGVAPADAVWRWLVWGLPKGLPDGRDHGLDSADTWGRTYWGGALFCFLADVEIRRVTHDRRSLGDALRAVLETCGGVSSDAAIDAVLSAGDGAIGHPVLRELYDRLGTKPGTVDLPALFRLLGVRASGGGVLFDDAAPYAAIRKGIATDETSAPGRHEAAVGDAVDRGSRNVASLRCLLKMAMASLRFAPRRKFPEARDRDERDEARRFVQSSEPPQNTQRVLPVRPPRIRRLALLGDARPVRLRRVLPARDVAVSLRPADPLSRTGPRDFLSFPRSPRFSCPSDQPVGAFALTRSGSRTGGRRISWASVGRRMPSGGAGRPTAWPVSADR